MPKGKDKSKSGKSLSGPESKWQLFVDDKYVPWYGPNKSYYPNDNPPNPPSANYQSWGENDYTPWYSRNAGSNPGGDPPPKPPGFQAP